MQKLRDAFGGLSADMNLQHLHFGELIIPEQILRRLGMLNDVP
jgi:hypothetical protein